MDLIKQLTGKNSTDYEAAAVHIINNADSSLFKKLVEQDDFLFDFVKNNVAQRLERACNQDNFKNLLEFLSYYSPFYDEFIAKTLAKYSDEGLIDEMLRRLKSGSNEEKTYCAKFFSYVENPLSIEPLQTTAYSEFEPLAFNSAITLSKLKDRISVDNALTKLQSDDEFKRLSAVKFLSAYQEYEALNEIFKVMKKSTMAEYIAAEIGYMASFLNLLDTEYMNDTLIAIDNILDGLGEIIPISQIYTFQLYEVFEKLIFTEPNSKSTIILLNAKNKFNQLTENDEYLYDEDKNTKNEVNEIKNLLNNNVSADLIDFIDSELCENSDFIYSALDLTNDAEKIKHLLSSKNQTIVLKTLEIIKSLNKLDEIDKNEVLKNVTNENIKSIILAL